MCAPQLEINTEHVANAALKMAESLRAPEASTRAVRNASFNFTRTVITQDSSATIMGDLQVRTNDHLPHP